VDEALGIKESLSKGVRHDIVKLSADRTFEEAGQVYEELMRVKVGVTTIWEKTQAAGILARPGLNPISTRCQSSERPNTGMAILMDGFMAPVRQEGWKEVKIGCVCAFERTGEVQTRKPDKEPIEGVHAFDQSFAMHLGGPEGFSVKLAAEVQARRWQDAPERTVLGDGATWLWNIAKHDYPDAAHQVDGYHGKQHLYAAAEMIYSNQPDQAHAWVDRQADLLYAGQAIAIADSLLVLTALANPDERQKLQSEAGYFSNNHEPMQYRDFQNAGLPIGSGTIESGAKRTKKRVASSGMRWSRPGLENMLALRAASLSHSFDDLWQRICPFLRMLPPELLVRHPSFLYRLCQLNLTYPCVLATLQLHQ
jgi:hypothetical protein